ncbi:MAG: alpha/beta hydrolase [Cyanobacteria bacterium P01_C01_bin.120]
MTTQALNSNTPGALWLSVNPSFRRFEQQLLGPLNCDRVVDHWGYSQTPDEPSDLEVALILLHDYLKSCDRPLHLIGHGTSGLVGLLYARRFPQRVKSLTLLAVGVQATWDWKAHYYKQLNLLPCSRTRVLAQMIHNLFGRQSHHCLAGLLELLERDLTESLSLHSLLHQFNLPADDVPVPLLVCGGQADPIVDLEQIQSWYSWLKQGDRVWLCPNGQHFFHATHPQITAAEIIDFWQEIDVRQLFPAEMQTA